MLHARTSSRKAALRVLAVDLRTAHISTSIMPSETPRLSS